MEEWAAYFLFGVTPIAAAGAMWAVFQFLKDSIPLKEAILETLTNPKRPPAERLREQYDVTRNKVIGSSFAGWKRLVAVTGAMTVWSAILTVQYTFAPQSFLGVVASVISRFAANRPMPFIGLLLFTVMLLLVVIQVFDLLLTATVFRRSSIALNAGLLVFAYAVSLLASGFGATVSGEVYLRYEMNVANAFSLPDISKLIGRSIWITYLGVKTIYLLPASLILGIQMLFQPFDHLWFFKIAISYGNELFDVMFAHFAFLPLLMSSVMALTILNLAYFVGLLFVRIDYWYREKYKIDQTKILEQPVEYLGRIACCVTVFAVIAINIVVWLVDGKGLLS